MSFGLDTSIRHHTQRKLLALYDYHGAYELRVNLAPNKVYETGRVLAQYATAANDVQSFAQTGGPTSGYARVRVYHPISGASATIDVPFDASAATILGLVQGKLGPNFTAAGGPLGTAPVTLTAAGAFVNMPVILFKVEGLAYGGGTNPSLAITKTTNGRTAGTFDFYASGGSGGLEVARAINAYEVATNSGGWVTHGPVAIEGYQGEVYPSVPAYFSGIFATEELKGLDADAVADLGRIWRGTISKGELRVF
jgi:hypothetical protein